MEPVKIQMRVDVALEALCILSEEIGRRDANGDRLEIARNIIRNAVDDLLDELLRKEKEK